MENKKKIKDNVCEKIKYEISLLINIIYGAHGKFLITLHLPISRVSF